jgi:hypothetical protein
MRQINFTIVPGINTLAEYISIIYSPQPEIYNHDLFQIRELHRTSKNHLFRYFNLIHRILADGDNKKSPSPNHLPSLFPLSSHEVT